MESNFSLDGSMVPRAVTRHVDHRAEGRTEVQSQSAVLEFRGRNHLVQLVNVSPSGAMIIFSLIPNIGEPIRIELCGRGRVAGRVCWVKGGRIGVTFVDPLE